MGVSAEFIDRHFGPRERGPLQPGGLRIASPPPPRPRSWGRVWSCLRELLADPDRTEKVFELMEAFGGRGDERCFQRFLASQDGPRLLVARPDLVARLADAEALAGLRPDSLGRRYLAFRRGEGLSADGLVDLNHDSLETHAELDPERGWFFDRLTAMHDLWHVVTGYGTDLVGEAALLAFSVPQIGSRPLALIALGAGLQASFARRAELQRFLLRARLRGRRARFLPAADWERLLPLPLDEVRGRLAVEPPSHAHPHGLLRGDGRGPCQRVGSRR